MPERVSKTSMVPVVWVILDFFRRDPNDFLSRLVTLDKTWLYHYEPETKQQSIEWGHRGSPRPEIFLVQKSAGKFLASIFCEETASSSLSSKGPKYQLGVLLISAGAIEGNFDGKMPRGVHQRDFILPRQFPAHRAPAPQKKLDYLGFVCLDHPPYSPDLAPSDYHLFPGLKK